jgi:nucleoside triphosphatase
LLSFRALIVVPIVRREDGRPLFCRKPNDRGVFPRQWGFPGGGVEDDETIEDALRRETLYMVFLIYVCTVGDVDPVINDEFEAFAWITPDELASYDVNDTTRATLREAGITTR